MSESDDKLTLHSLLLYIQETLTDFLSKGYVEYTEDEEDTLSDLRGAIQVLMNFASEKKVREIYEIAEDLEYAINHLNLADFKAKSGLESAKGKIAYYFEKYD